MELELSGKTALVTGASRGIGRAIAETLIAEGCKVAINARNADVLALAASEAGCAIAIPGDVSDPQQAGRIVAEAIQAMGRLDILVCNVGSGRSVAPGLENPEEWQRVFAVNLWGTTNMVEAARAALKASRGNVVCISSICGLEVIPGAPVTYSAAKAALHAYVRGMARPLGAEGIRINAIAPGNIVFDGSVWAQKMASDAPGVEAMLQANVPAGRLGTPAEVASLASWLVSSRSGFATGAIWTLDGGQTRA